MGVGCPWRDLPADFGCWNSIYQQFNRWSSKNKLMRIFKTLVQEPDLEWEFIDSSIVNAHQHSAGAPNKAIQAIGKSVAGNTTKIHKLKRNYSSMLAMACSYKQTELNQKKVMDINDVIARFDDINLQNNSDELVYIIQFIKSKYLTDTYYFLDPMFLGCC